MDKRGLSHPFLGKFMRNNEEEIGVLTIFIDEFWASQGFYMVLIRFYDVNSRQIMRFSCVNLVIKIFLVYKMSYFNPHVAA